MADLRSFGKVNLVKLRERANRESRRSSRNSFGRAPQRASTIDAEHGEGGRFNDTDPLSHATSAPSTYARGRESSDIGNSQATTVPGDEGLVSSSNGYENGFETDPKEGGLRRRVGTGSPEGPSGENPETEKPAEKLRFGFIRHIDPKEPFTVRNQFERTIGSSYLNVLLVCAPAGIAIYYAGVNGQIVFAVNFIAIIPLAAMLGFATEEIALRTGETLGGLINATFG